MQDVRKRNNRQRVRNNDCRQRARKDGNRGQHRKHSNRRTPTGNTFAYKSYRNLYRVYESASACMSESMCRSLRMI